MVELVVALSVLAVGVVGVIGVLQSTFGVAVGNNHRSKAVALATRELESLRSTPWDQLAPSADSTPRQVRVGGTTYSVARAVTTEADGQKEATVVVSWESGGGRVSDLHQTTKIYPGGVLGVTTTTAPASLSGLLAAPTALLATLPTEVDGGTTVDLAWTNPVPANPTASNLVVEWSVNGAENSWHRVYDDLASTVNRVRVPGLASGTTYKFRVGATGGDGSVAAWSPVSVITTGSSAGTTCTYGRASVSPSQVRRHQHHLHQLAQPVTVSIHTSGTCVGLHVVYEPNEHTAPQSWLLAPSSGGVWSATLPEVVGRQWSVGVHPITFHDQLETKHATAYLTVCDWGAASC